MTSTPRRPVTIDDLLDLHTVGDLALAPDGSVALFVMGRNYDESDKPAPRSLMAVSPRSGSVARSFSTDGAVDHMPRWSPDGRTVAFLSNRPHNAPEAHLASVQVYLLPRDGGEARRLTAVQGSVHDMAWVPDGSKLVLLMTDPETEEERRRVERAGAVDVERQPHFWRLWSVDMSDGEAAPLTPGGVQVWEFGLSADGAVAALVVSDSSFEWSWYQARLAVATLGASEIRTIYTTPRQLAHPRLSPDGMTVAAISCTWSDRGVIGGDVLLVPARGGEARNLTAGRTVSVSWLEWEPDGTSLLCCGYEEGEIALWRLDAGNGPRALWRGQCTFVEQFQPRFSRAGNTIAVLREDTAHPVDLWVAQLDGDTISPWSQVTGLHPQTEEWSLGAVRTLRWRASDGTPIQGLLALPPDHDDSARLPLVVLVHGGPAFLQPYAFSLDIVHWARLLTAQGFAVLLPNPRGSSGWGSAFTEANLGDMGGADFMDIMAGVDHAVDSGVVDAGRLGIGGFSYGGFMAAWAVTRTDRFKASVMFGGIADWRSFHGVGPVPTWDALAYGPLGRPADPYDPAGPHTRFSPLTYSERTRTPTLILCGEGDSSQGYQFFRALKDRGTEVEMTIYPREGHGIRERAHVRDMDRHVVDWFAQHLR